MPAFDWRRRQTGWFSRHQAWSEWLAGGWILGIVLVLVLALRVSVVVTFAVALVGLLSLAVLIRHGQIPLFGPILSYELVRAARRGRPFLARTLYALGLGLAVIWVGLLWIWNTPVKAADAARLAEALVAVLLALQLLAVLILTPVYVAGAVAGEKESRTLDYLLTTDLHGRELVLGKFVARVAHLGLFLLAGLPIYAAVQFLGGVEPGWLLAGFFATALTMSSLAAVGLLASVQQKRVRDAITVTYLVLAAYLALSTIGLAAQGAITSPTGGPVVIVGDWTVDDVIALVSSGNPLVEVFELEKQLKTGIPLADVLPNLLERYAGFHLAVTVGCLTVAGWRLRPVAIRQASDAPTRAASRRRVLPEVWRWPVLWREVVVERGQRLGLMGRAGLGGLVIVSLIPGLYLIGTALTDVLQEPPWAIVHESGGQTDWDDLTTSINTWVRLGGTMIGLLMLLGVSVRAANAFSGERDRQTLDGLLTAPLSDTAIVLGKWLGCVRGTPGGWRWLAAVAGLAWLGGGLHPAAIPLYAGVWLVFAGPLAGIGLWLSLTCKTTLRATVWSLAIAGLALGGHWFLVLGCGGIPLMIVRPAWADQLDWEWIVKFGIGLTPPAVLYWLPMRDMADPDVNWPTTSPFARYALAGMAVWTVASVVVVAAVLRRFRTVFHRRASGPERRREPGEGR